MWELILVLFCARKCLLGRVREYLTSILFTRQRSHQVPSGGLAVRGNNGMFCWVPFPVPIGHGAGRLVRKETVVRLGNWLYENIELHVQDLRNRQSLRRIQHTSVVNYSGFISVSCTHRSVGQQLLPPTPKYPLSVQCFSEGFRVSPMTQCASLQGSSMTLALPSLPRLPPRWLSSTV